MESLIESFRLKIRQLHHAIRHGDDQLVMVLDREIDPLINRIVNRHAESGRETLLQLQLICELIREDASDRPGIMHNTEVLMALFARYVSGGGAIPAVEQVATVGVFAASDDGRADEPTFHQALIDAVPDRVLAVTADHRVIYANDAAASYHGIDPVSMAGRHISEFVGRDRYERDIAGAINTCIADTGRSVEIRSCRPEAATAIGLPVIRTVIRAIRNPDKRAACVLVIDQDLPIA